MRRPVTIIRLDYMTVHTHIIQVARVPRLIQLEQGNKEVKASLQEGGGGGRKKGWEGA